MLSHPGAPSIRSELRRLTDGAVSALILILSLWMSSKQSCILTSIRHISLCCMRFGDRWSVTPRSHTTDKQPDKPPRFTDSYEYSEPPQLPQIELNSEESLVVCRRLQRTMNIGETDLHRKNPLLYLTRHSCVCELDGFPFGY